MRRRVIVSAALVVFLVAAFMTGVELGYRRGCTLTGYMQAHSLAQHCVAIKNKMDRPAAAILSLDQFLGGALREIETANGSGIMGQTPLSYSERNDRRVYLSLIEQGRPILERVRFGAAISDAPQSEPSPPPSK